MIGISAAHCQMPKEKIVENIEITKNKNLPTIFE